MKKKEWLMVLAVLVLAGGMILWTLLNKGSGTTVQVYHGEEVVLEFDPEKDAVYDIEGDYGGLQIEVKDGSWHVINEECPNHICASMGWQDKDSLIPITCIPNNIIIIVSEAGE